MEICPVGFKPGVRCLMMYVRRIKQRSEHITVEQSDQWRRLGFVIPQAIYDLGRD